MARPDRLGLSSVRTEGAILPPSVLKRIHELSPTLAGTSAEDFGLSGTRVREAASQAWNALQLPWMSFSMERAKLTSSDPGIGVTRRAWINQILKALDYGTIDPSKSALSIGDDLYAVSHLYNGNVPMHLVGCGLDLDKRAPGTQGTAQRSPHGLVQKLLNASQDYLWAFVSNGLKWRVLRDDQSLSRQSMVEFDLESIFEGQLYDEFLLFYIVCHYTRVKNERPEECWLEKWHSAAGEEGKRALNTLRSGVEDAIKSLGQGFLSHPSNTILRQKIRAGQLDKQDYYRQLLRQVYRLLFLFVAEDRGLLADPKSSVEARQLFAENYSTTRLRRMAEKIPGSERHHDLYLQLKLILAKLGASEGCPELGIPALGSFLFSESTAGDIDQAEISNRAFLKTLRHLATTHEGGRRTRIDYKNLGTEELGSVYESLLELHPEFTNDGNSFDLVMAGGNERKTTGSYYTPDSLIQCLLDTALEPVVDDAISRAGRELSKREAALLNLRVIDPAVGSGHFLIAAGHRLAKRLAQLRAGEDEPSPDERRRALRDVIGHCLYGIDINPMAAELCKVSLWLEAIEPGKPLSFLDHHIVVGNSLLGATAQLIAQGVPDAAFDPIEGDDKELCKVLKKRNKEERESKQGNLFDPSAFAGKELLEAWHELEELPEDSLEDIRTKEKTFRGAESALAERKLMADAWCTAFTAPKTPAKPGEPTSGQVITTSTLRRLANGVTPSNEECQLIQDCAQRFQFLHPELTFPGVFAKGGFDVVIGNPPWERVKLQEKEFFAERRPEIATATNKAERERMIKALFATALHREFLQAKRDAEASSMFMRKSERFPLAGRGDVNTYAVFTELNRNLLNAYGRAGIIVPSGIATDDTTKFFFADLTDKRCLASLYDFENGMRESEEASEGDDAEEEEAPKPRKRKKSAGGDRRIFPGVDARTKFSLLTITGTKVQPKAPQFAFFCHRTTDITTPGKAFTLTPEEFALLNPNTKTCPVFRSQRDAEITKAIYRRVPVLVREGDPMGNPWGISFQRMFDMSNDSELFRTREELEEAGGVLEGNRWVVPATRIVDGKEISAGEWPPLYEAKMMQQFDHRAADIVKSETAVTRQNQPSPIPSGDKRDQERLALPMNWVHQSEVEIRTEAHYLLGFTDITSPTNMRTMIASCLPKAAVGHTMPLISSGQGHLDCSLLLAALNSYPFDYVSRQKVGGLHFTYSYLKQIPLLKRSNFAESCLWEPGHTILCFLAPRTLELTYSAYDLTPFARDMGYRGDPFIWDEERRFWLRAELDAAFFHLYGLARDDVDYIMETFPIVKRKDIAAHGTYRTKEAILAIYDEMAQALATGASYQTKLDPPPANGWVPPPLPPLEDYVEPEKDSKPTNSRVAESKAPYQTSSGAAVAKAGKPAPNLFEAPVPTLFDEDDAEEAPAPPPAASGKAIINGQPVEVLKIVKLDVTRSQYHVILVSTGEMKSYVSPPAKVQML